MKSAIATVDKQPVIITQMETDSFTEKATSGRKLLIVGAVIGLICLVVIAGVSIGAFYLGMNAERESVQEAWVNFKAGANQTIIKERVIVSEKEAEYRRPGVMNMVVDYENNVLVMQYDQELEGDEQVYCYVYDYEPGMFGTIEEAESIVNGDKTHLTDPKADERFKFKPSGELVPLEELSLRAREMCRGAEIMKVHKTDNEGDRQRRGCSWQCGYQCRYDRCGWYCAYRCSWRW